MQIIEYHPKSETLIVAVPGFPRYEVFDVPSSTYENLLKATSPRDYFNEHIWGTNFEHDSHWPNLKSLLAYMEEHMFFESPVTVFSRAGDEDTPLHTACIWGDVSAVRLLLANGADPNARGDMECTPMYNAVSFERVRIARLLLEAGATSDDENQISSTARQKALRSKNPQLVALFRHQH